LIQIAIGAVSDSPELLPSLVRPVRAPPLSPRHIPSLLGGALPAFLAFLDSHIRPLLSEFSNSPAPIFHSQRTGSFIPAPRFFLLRQPARSFRTRLTGWRFPPNGFTTL